MNAQAKICRGVNLLLTTLGNSGPTRQEKTSCQQGFTEMSNIWFDQLKAEAPLASVIIHSDDHGEDLLVASCLAAAAQGDSSAYYDLGVAYSTGSHGVGCDLIEAHKWFNLAAVAGHGEAALCRADISDEMSAREIAEAQRRAREWLSAIAPRRAA